MVLSFGSIHGSKVVIIEDMDVGLVGFGVSVRGGGGRHEGVNRWVVREVFRAEVRDMSLSKSWKQGDEFFEEHFQIQMLILNFYNSPC